MFYKYETHLHTSEVSKCAFNTGAEMARAYKEAGFTGIFVTDHFFNGNTIIPKELDWKEKVDLLYRGYESAKAEGDKIGLDVFFGWEFTLKPYFADFLTYNLGKDFLLAHPNIDKLPIRDYSRLVRNSGGLIIHAHPYRIADYMSCHFKPKPYLADGIEVNNTTSDTLQNYNHKAWGLARNNPRHIRISGTDIHSTNRNLVGMAGVAFPYRIESVQHFVDALRAGDAKLIIDGKITDREGRPMEEVV
jgi:hypothetical protein